jgi:integrase
MSRHAGLERPAHRGIRLDIEFDFVFHELVFRTSEGDPKDPTRPVSLPHFFEEFARTLASLGLSILAALLGCGLRRSEAAQLIFEHLQLRDDYWAIVDLFGKGGHIR